VPVLPIMPPHSIPVLSGFDYVQTDAKRHRVFAAHTASNALTVIDGVAGKVLGQIDVGGPAQGVSVDPNTGNVFTGNGTARTITKVDPVRMKIIGTVDVDGPVDALAYDPVLDRLYADEDNGTRIFVIAGKTMKRVGEIKLPGHKPEYLDINPATHEIYQNLADRGQIVVIDPRTLAITKTIATRVLTGNHPLQFDPRLGQIVAAGTNGTMAAYALDGTALGSLAVPKFDQCNLERVTHVLACAGSGTLGVFALHLKAAPTLLGSVKVPGDAHTVAIDPASKRIWIVYASVSGDAVRAYRYAP